MLACLGPDVATHAFASVCSKLILWMNFMSIKKKLWMNFTIAFLLFFWWEIFLCRLSIFIGSWNNSCVKKIFIDVFYVFFPMDRIPTSAKDFDQELKLIVTFEYFYVFGSSDWIPYYPICCCILISISSVHFVFIL